MLSRLNDEGKMVMMVQDNFYGMCRI